MYLTNLKTKISIAFRKIMSKLDEKITKFQRRYRFELERKKITLKKEKMERERKKEKLETRQQIK